MTIEMKLYTNIINFAFHYVIQTSKHFHIDESHALRHSMEVYQFANNIYDSQVELHPYLEQQKEIILCSAILHDMCDKKYMNEKDGVDKMNQFMKDYIDPKKLNIINKIITTMSYSTVKKNGYPELGEYNIAYHIVREADLLAGYDVERCIIYQMMRENYDYISSVLSAKYLFEERIFQYLKDGLFTLEYSRNIARVLHDQAIIKMKDIYKINYG